MALFIAHLVITAGFLLIIANLVKGIHIEGWRPALIGAFLLGLANALVRPVMILLTLPLTVVTFGLFLLVVNGITLRFAASLTPGAKIDGCGAAIVGSVLLSLLNFAIDAVLGPTWSG